MWPKACLNALDTYGMFPGGSNDLSLSTESLDVLSELDQFLRPDPAATSARRTSPVGLILITIDLDDLTPSDIEDPGLIGEQLVVALSERLAGETTEGDLIRRAELDQLAVIRPGVKAPEEATALAYRLHASLQEPLTIDDRPFACPCSLGATTSIEGDDAKTLMDQAQQAVEAAQLYGRCELVVFDDLNRER